MNHKDAEVEGKKRSEYHELASALEHFEDILKVVRHNMAVVCLDYDGTLTPIVENPAEAHMEEDMRARVKSLAEKIPVAIVSGRGMEFIKEQVGLQDVYYAGSHGFELAGPEGFNHEVEEAKDALPLLDEVEKELESIRDDMEGIEIERKKFGIAVHYRKLQEAKLPTLKRKIEEIIRDSPGLKQGKGKKVIEIKPAVDWNKGKAVEMITAKISNDSSDATAMYIGDDITDEDAFESLDQGIGILVGSHDEKSAADYRLSDVKEVKQFLEKLTSKIDS